MKSYNLTISVNGGEYETAIRIDGNIAPFEAMDRAFWAVNKEFYPEDSKGEVEHG